MRTLRYSRPVTAIKHGDKIVVGFGFSDLPFSYHIRDYGELRALFTKNPALVRNVVAHYLRVCGLSTVRIGQFLDISPSRVSSVSTKGWRAIYPQRRRHDYTGNRSYVLATSQLETRRWNSRIQEFRSRSPRDGVPLQRLADREGTTPFALCARIAAETGLRIATVDTILWRACANGVIESTTGRIAGFPRLTLRG